MKAQEIIEAHEKMLELTRLQLRKIRRQAFQGSLTANREQAEVVADILEATDTLLQQLERHTETEHYS